MSYKDKLVKEREKNKSLRKKIRQLECLSAPENIKSPSYDSEFGDDLDCACGHPYYRHFDSYEDMSPVGCKYCHCAKWRDPQDVKIRIFTPSPDSKTLMHKINDLTAIVSLTTNGAKWEISDSDGTLFLGAENKEGSDHTFLRKILIMVSHALDGE